MMFARYQKHHTNKFAFEGPQPEKINGWAWGVKTQFYRPLVMKALTVQHYECAKCKELGLAGSQFRTVTDLTGHCKAISCRGSTQHPQL